MDIKEILSRTDHTLLKQTATWEDIKQVITDAKTFGCASACIPPYFVKRAKEEISDPPVICTVIGFPNGYSVTKVKCLETRQAVKDGADEIDMVININMVKDGLYKDIKKEINLVKKECPDKILKVIIETCLLTQKEKIEMCRTISKSNADYIKTSTGFAGAGATLEDISLFNKYAKNGKLIKAAGGIRTLDDAAAFINSGASRIGTSSIVSIVKKQGTADY